MIWKGGHSSACHGLAARSETYRLPGAKRSKTRSSGSLPCPALMVAALKVPSLLPAHGVGYMDPVTAFLVFVVLFGLSLAIPWVISMSASTARSFRIEGRDLAVRDWPGAVGKQPRYRLR